MRPTKLLTTLAIAMVVLITGCKKDGFFSNASDMASIKLASNQALALTTTVPLGTASTFAVLAGTTVTNDEASVLTGDLGVSPGTAITGFQPVPINTIMGPGTVTAGLGVVNGTIYAGGPVAAQAHMDAVVAYNYLVAQVPNTLYTGVTQLDGLTLTPGVYNFASSANLLVGGTLTLDFQGNSDAQFIFQLGSTLVTMTNSNIIAINTGNVTTCIGSNVYWAVGSSATIDGNSFIGTVIAYTTITMTNTGNVSGTTNVSGRMLALGGEVTMVNSIISTCGTSGGGTKPPKPCRDFVTGGGWIDGIANVSGHKYDKNDKATFGVSGGILNGKFWGQLSYTDHGKDGVKVKSTSVTGYRVINATTREITGIAKVNGRGSFTYTVVVVDNGEPAHKSGHIMDSFSLVLSNGYSNSGTLEGGNIQLHMICGDSHDNHDKCDKENYYDQDEHDGNQNCGKDNDWRR